MDDLERHHGRNLAKKIADQWQARARVLILVVVMGGYLIDALLFENRSAGAFIIFMAFWAHIGLQVWLPEKVYMVAYQNSLKAVIKG